MMSNDEVKAICRIAIDDAKKRYQEALKTHEIHQRERLGAGRSGEGRDDDPGEKSPERRERHSRGLGRGKRSRHRGRGGVSRRIVLG